MTDATSAPGFREFFGQEPRVRAHAPGRVNLIGEHTDYNEGLVLPAPLPRETTVEVAPRSSLLVRAVSAQMPGPGGMPAVLEYELGSETRDATWLDYVRGVTNILLSEGYRIEGFDLRIDSQVPVGSGLASSAALLVALLRALRRAFGLNLDDVRLALLARKAETDFVGAPAGVMDQMAASLATPGEALFIDTRSLHHERLALPQSADLTVVDSGVSPSHAGDEYRRRREACEQAASALGLSALRDLPPSELPALASLPPEQARRARHVVTENARVAAAVRALREADLDQLGQLFYASHASLRDDFEVSIAELDLLVRLARSHSAVYGARMTGGGFGGSIVVLARENWGERVASAIAEEYLALTGRHAVSIAVTPQSG